jgi:hypothetical protein
MNTIRPIDLISPCAIYCGGCSLYLVKDRPELKPILLQHGVKEEDLPCPGCRAVDGHCKHLDDGQCEQFVCAKEKQVTYCHECDEFPCNRLHPAADRADSLPHNLKMFAQCYISKHGPEAYIAKLPEMRKRYFAGKISYGKGPRLPEDE